METAGEFQGIFNALSELTECFYSTFRPWFVSSPQLNTHNQNEL